MFGIKPYVKMIGGRVSKFLVCVAKRERNDLHTGGNDAFWNSY
jgi:hypothetical protein